MSRDIINEVAPFHCCNGGRLRSVIDFALSLEDMEDHVFKFHVTQDKNDFAKWISEVTQDNNFAKLVGDIKDRDSMRYQTMKYILLNLR